MARTRSSGLSDDLRTTAAAAAKPSGGGREGKNRAVVVYWARCESQRPSLSAPAGARGRAEKESTRSRPRPIGCHCRSSRARSGGTWPCPHRRFEWRVGSQAGTRSAALMRLGRPLLCRQGAPWGKGVAAPGAGEAPAPLFSFRGGDTSALLDSPATNDLLNWTCDTAARVKQSDGVSRVGNRGVGGGPCGPVTGYYCTYCAFPPPHPLGCVGQARPAVTTPWRHRGQWLEGPRARPPTRRRAGSNHRRGQVGVGPGFSRRRLPCSHWGARPRRARPPPRPRRVPRAAGAASPASRRGGRA